MREIRRTGGGNAGAVQATWPFASLTVNRNQLLLRIALAGSYAFSPDDVVAIEEHGRLPFLASGIRIVHINLEYPKSLIFWYMGSKSELVKAIQNTGFLPNGNPDRLEGFPSGFPVHWPVVVGLVVVWNALFLTDRYVNQEPSTLSFLAIVLMMVFSWTMLNNRLLQDIVLREGHRIGPSKPFFQLIGVISTILAVVLGISLWFENAT